MPHSIFFTYKGHAIHGSFAGHIGSPASHGCIRLAPENAAKLYDLVEQQGLPNTKVVLTATYRSQWSTAGVLPKNARPPPSGRPPNTPSAPTTRVPRRVPTTPERTSLIIHTSPTAYGY
jgi:hypothetical protein